MRRFSIIFLICALLAIASAASPPSFCKCTCFTNSKIIQLGPSSKPASSNPSTSSLLRSLPLSSFLDKRAASSCNKCNRAFCLAQGIPFCKDAGESDVLTTCFQRDSRKDQIIVLLFIAATVSLLVWAGVRRLLQGRADRGGRAESLGEYVPVGGR